MTLTVIAHSLPDHGRHQPKLGTVSQNGSGFWHRHRRWTGSRDGLPSTVLTRRYLTWSTVVDLQCLIPAPLDLQSTWYLRVE